MERILVCIVAVFLSVFANCLAESNGTVPVVIWHGMGEYEWPRIRKQLLEIVHFIRQFVNKLADALELLFCMVQQVIGFIL